MYSNDPHQYRGIHTNANSISFVNIGLSVYNRQRISLLAGISWYIGHGSLDVGFRIGKEFSTMIGYTYIPQFNKGRKK